MKLLTQLVCLITLNTVLLAGCASVQSGSESDVSTSETSGAIVDSSTPAGEESATDVAPSSTEGDSEDDSVATLLADTTIIPGEQFGPVGPDTTRQSLVEQFGDERLTDEEFNVGEGFMEPATLVDLEDGYAFTVIWEDASRTKPVEIRDIGPAWQGPEGVQTGMSFSELESVLGEFQLFGLGWDYGGTVMLEGTPLETYSDSLILRLEPGAETPETNAADFQAVLGDRLYESSNPHFESLDLSVDDMIVRLAPLPQ